MSLGHGRRLDVVPRAAGGSPLESMHSGCSGFFRGVDLLEEHHSPGCYVKCASRSPGRDWPGRVYCRSRRGRRREVRRDRITRDG
jgi:hypothetical protein